MEVLNTFFEETLLTQGFLCLIISFFEMGLFSIWAGTVTIPNDKRPLPPPLRLTEATKDVTEIKRVRTKKPL